MRSHLPIQFLVLMFAALPVAVIAAPSDRITPEKQIYTEVFVRPNGDGRPEEVSGNLISYDDTSVAIKTVKGQRDLDWISLTATSAFTLRSRLIDKKVAAQWLELGKFGWSIAAKDQARSAMATATGMDGSLKSQGDAILAGPAGAALPSASSASPAAPDPVAGGSELIGPAPATQESMATPRAFGMIPRPVDDSPKSPTETFQKSTPEQDERAIIRAKQGAAGVGQQFHVTFTTLETKHFLIFTDWDPQEYDFLKTNFEDAYTEVSRQFEIPNSENVFVGKLPVYLFANFNDYAKLTDSIGFLSQPTPRTLRGYYQGQPNGSGRMVMYKPGVGDVAEAEKEWAHCLVHEFTHAFVARYRTNARVPRWLNEGIAEVIAAKSFPFPGTYPYAQRMAHQHKTAGTLFDDDKMPSGEWYPVMQTMVELLIAQDRSAFKKMFDDIKAGTDGETALQKFYNIDYHQLMIDWRQALLSKRP